MSKKEKKIEKTTTKKMARQAHASRKFKKRGILRQIKSEHQQMLQDKNQNQEQNEEEDYDEE